MTWKRKSTKKRTGVKTTHGHGRSRAPLLAMSRVDVWKHKAQAMMRQGAGARQG